jgi:hypothetical protein
MGKILRILNLHYHVSSNKSRALKKFRKYIASPVNSTGTGDVNKSVGLFIGE